MNIRFGTRYFLNNMQAVSPLQPNRLIQLLKRTYDGQLIDDSPQTASRFVTSMALCSFGHSTRLLDHCINNVMLETAIQVVRGEVASDTVSYNLSSTSLNGGNHMDQGMYKRNMAPKLAVDLDMDEREVTNGLENDLESLLKRHPAPLLMQEAEDDWNIVVKITRKLHLRYEMYNKAEEKLKEKPRERMALHFQLHRLNLALANHIPGVGNNNTSNPYRTHITALGLNPHTFNNTAWTIWETAHKNMTELCSPVPTFLPHLNPSGVDCVKVKKEGRLRH